VTASGPSSPAKRPQPVLGAAGAAAGLTTLVGLVLTLLVVTRVLTPGDSAVLGPAIASAVPTVVGAVSTVLAALRARTKVTPLADPRDAIGNRLVSAVPARLPSQETPGPDHAAG